jgi:hypothetical protein
MELRNGSNNTILAVYFQPSLFDLGKASDEDLHCSGWHRLIAESYEQIVFADPMFRSN